MEVLAEAFVDETGLTLVDATERLTVLLAQVAVLDAQVCGLVGVVQGAGLHREEGHRGVRDWLCHAGRLSGSEAWGYATVAAALSKLPAAAAAHSAGEVGCAQIRLLAAMAANPRIGVDALAEGDKLLTDDACCFGFDDLTRLVRRFVTIADPDGTRRSAENTHRNRKASMTKDFDGGWHLTSDQPDATGAAMADVLQRYIEAETLADWDTAREVLGDQVTTDDLARTPVQRRADALAQIFADAAANPNSSVPVDPAVVIVVDQQTIDDEIQRAFGDTPPPARPVADYREMRCETLDGQPVTPADALAAALLGQLRRVLFGTASVTINLGTASRFFKGNAALAARLQASRCYWPGCKVVASRCQIDHLARYGPRGPTDQTNAGCLCARHNQLKETGRYTVTRQTDGTITITKPDSTRIV